MGRTPCCDKEGLKKGPWTPDEDKILTNYIQKNGHGSWRALPKLAGLMRCGKSCRLRWTNYLRPDIKRGAFTEEEERSIIQLHAILGNRWSAIASQLPGRTDNEIKNYWNTRIRKKLLKMGLDPQTHTPKVEAGVQCGEGSWLVMTHKSQWENARLQAEARHSRATILSSFKSQHYFMSSSLSDQDSSSGGAPVDYFLKMWNSEAGKNFRARTNLKIWNSEAGKNFRARTNNINNPVSIHHHHQSMFSEETSYKHDQNPNPNTESLYSNSFGSLEMGMQACQVVEDMSYNNNARGQQEEQLSDSEHDLLGELQLEDQSTNNNFEGDHAYATRIELQQQQSTWPWPDLDLQEYEHDRCDWNGISDI